MAKKSIPPDEFNALVIAAKAIGSRLGKMAVAAHLATPDPVPAKKAPIKKRAATKKKAAKKLASPRIKKAAPASAKAKAKPKEE